MLNADSRITIPKAIREYLRLVSGDRIRFMKRVDGTVVILPRVATERAKAPVKRRAMEL